MEAAILRCSEPVRLRWEENRFQLITNWFAPEELAVGKFPASEGHWARLIRADKSLSTRFIKKTGNLIIEHSVCSFRLTRLSAVPSMSLILCRGFGNFFCHELLPYHHEAFTHTRAAITLNFVLLLASFRAKNHRFMCGSWRLTRESDVKIMILLVYCVRKFARLGGSNEISTKSPFSQSISQALLKFYDSSSALGKVNSKRDCFQVKV